MEPETRDDWMDRVARERLGPSDRAALRDGIASNPAEARRLERELALNDLLDGHRPAPRLPDQFAARVAAAVRRAEPVRRAPDWMSWLRAVLSPRAVAFAALALAAGAGYWRVETTRQGRIAREAAEVARVADAVDASALADFEAVRRLASRARAEDDALIVALAQ